MNGLFRGSELPELNNEDALLLYEIATRATESNEPPYKALYQARNYVLAEQGIEEAHDNVLFRWVTEIGERAHASSRAHLEIDLKWELKELLQTQNIRLLEPDDASDLSQDAQWPLSPLRNPGKANLAGSRVKQERRVSFGDAHVEETWLSEHSERLDASPVRPPSGLLSHPPRRSRGPETNLQHSRARSADSQHDSVQPAPWRFANSKYIDDDRTDKVEGTQQVGRSPLLFEPSETQLEQNADAFFYTTSLRAMRRCLHIWHDTALRQQQRCRHDDAVATSIDRRALMRQSFMELRDSLRRRLTEKQAEASWGPKEDQAQTKYENHLVFKAFTHMVREGLDRQRENAIAYRHMLRIRFFRRWREIAVENAQKSRSILYQKYLSVWRAQFARRNNNEEQAIAYYEERLTRSCLRSVSWTTYERRIVPWYELKIKERSLNKLHRALLEIQSMEDNAEDHYECRQARLVLIAAQQQVRTKQHCESEAQRHRCKTLMKKCLDQLRVQTELAPLARPLVDKRTRTVQSRILDIWCHCTALEQQAGRIDRKRILQHAWTLWNDNLRIKALAQPINERVLVENMYKWLLKTKMFQMQRWIDGRVVRKVLVVWNSKTGDLEAKLAAAQFSFGQHQRRRVMSNAMVCMNTALRQRDDCDRVALEFAHTTTLPKFVLRIKIANAHAQELNKWAADARWYCLTSRAIKLWRERTTQHQHQRRKDAYVRIRATIKLRLAGNTLRRWHTATIKVQHMNEAAEHRVEARTARAASTAFDNMRARSAQYVELSEQSTAIDHQKLLGSALQAMVTHHINLAEQEQQANDFRHETSLALVASALKCIEKATFAASCRAANAEAWNVRTRDQHVRQMIKHWAQQTMGKLESGAPKQQPDAPELESPSLRPASRAAARSQSRERRSSLPPNDGDTVTPAYMRSPSRSARARASRFRPLPPVAPLTPMAFVPAYYTTTPAPLTTSHRVGEQAAGDLILGPPLDVSGMTPQITPFARKLRAVGITPAGPPPSALKRSIFGRSVTGTAKSVRFVGSGRFGSGRRFAGVGS